MKNAILRSIGILLSTVALPVMAQNKVLMVLTSHAVMGDSGERTGFWLGELTHPYYVLVDAGFSVDIASIAGGPAPIDPRSMDEDDPANQRFLKDANAMRGVMASRALKDIDPSEYRAVVYAGGHGTMWDFPGNDEVLRVTRAIWNHDGVVAAVCHGPAALVDLKLENGKPLIEGKSVAGFTNEEEASVQLTEVVPFSLQDRLKDSGAKFSEGAAFKPHVVVDGQLVTGQNPQSAKAVGEAVVKLLK